MKLHYSQQGKSYAKALRRDMPPAEAILWAQLKGRKLGLQFYRQRPIGKYIVDFYCPKAKLVVELDGSQHFSETAEGYDLHRDAYLSSQRLRILRIPNNEVFGNLRGVIERILALLK